MTSAQRQRIHQQTRADNPSLQTHPRHIKAIATPLEAACLYEYDDVFTAAAVVPCWRPVHFLLLLVLAILMGECRSGRICAAKYEVALPMAPVIVGTYADTTAADSSSPGCKANVNRSTILETQHAM